MANNVFLPADILLFNGPDQTAFSVVACDQYTSEPEYWDRVGQYVGSKPSALHLIYPEAYLKAPDFERRIDAINQNMTDYLQKKLFETQGSCFLYVERTLRNGKIRHGLIGKIDLEAYDFNASSQSPVRATEGTVLSRIPPRVKIRENAPLELPHIMLLIDDREKTVIEPLADRKQTFRQIYSFDLMENSGKVQGYLVSQGEEDRILTCLNQFLREDSFRQKYDVPGKDVLAYAVGDGNHSLATVRQCYLNLKKKIGDERALSHPARYALCELVNLHDDSLRFEAVHRILFGVNPEDVITEFFKKFPPDSPKTGSPQQITFVTGGNLHPVVIQNPAKNLAVGTLQSFLDDYVQQTSCEIDYIHGEDVVRTLSQKKDSIGFLLPPMDKNELFKTVILDGALPRKTFSMGDACDKRFYYEARRIQ